MNAMITSDALGKIGEHTFSVLCAASNMTFNQSHTWDRAGWDFIVDLGPTDRPGITLDQRPSPRSCRVQVKTIGLTKTAVEVSLKMAERLAKDAGPSFVLAFQVNAANIVARAYLIPMLDAALATVLKRLRRESTQGDGRLGNKRLRLALPETASIAVTGVALKEAILQHIGPDMHAYVARKKAQMDHLGFDERPYEGSFTVAAHLQTTLEQMFLGRANRLEVQDFEISQTRFGMTQVIDGPTTAQMSITAHPIDTGTVIVRPTGQAPLVFEGDVYISPAHLGASVRLQLALFDLLFDGRQRDRFQLSFHLLDKTATPVEWLAFWTALDAIHRGEATMEVRSTTLPIRTELRPNGPSTGVDAATLARNLSICRDLAAIAVHAGWPTTVRLSPSAIMERTDWIRYVARVIDGTKQSVRFHANADEPLGDGAPEPTVFVCHFPIGTHMLACYATADMSWSRDEGKLTFDLRNLAVKQSSLLPSADNLPVFVERAKVQESIAREFVMGEGGSVG